MRAYAELRRLESCAAHAAAGRAEAAEIVLARHDIAAIGEEACFLQRLAECDVGPDALAAGFFVVIAHDVGDGAIELRTRVAPRDVGGHLLLRRLGRAENRDSLRRRVLGQQQLVIRRRQPPRYAFDGLLVELAQELRAKVGPRNRDVACDGAFGDFGDRLDSGYRGREKGAHAHECRERKRITFFHKGCTPIKEISLHLFQHYRIMNIERGIAWRRPHRFNTVKPPLQVCCTGEAVISFSFLRKSTKGRRAPQSIAP